MTPDKPQSQNSTFRFAWADGWIFLTVFGCWMTGSFTQFLKYRPQRASLLCLVGAVAVAVALLLLRWMQTRNKEMIGWGWFAFLGAVLVVLYLVLYPISQRHVLGVGSDSEDALRRSAYQLLHLRYPYNVRTYLGNPISPMPGAIFLALPFYLLGRVSFQNIAWLGALLVFCVSFFQRRSTAFAFLLILTLASASTLDNFVVGDDYVTNAWYISVLVYFFLKTFEANPRGRRHALAGVLLGLAFGSRPTFVVIPLLVLAYELQCGKGKSVAWRSVALPVVVAACVTLPFYFYDPNHFSPLHIRGKLSFLPPGESAILTVTLPILAIAVTSIGFLIRLTYARLFLIAGLAIAVITFTPALMSGLRGGWGLLDYSIPSAIFIGLWAFSSYERPPSARLPPATEA